MRNNIIRLLLGSILLFFHYQAFTQTENIWYFGHNAGLNFNVNPPQVLLNSGMVAWESTAVRCDFSGNIMFYSNGEKVYNKNHEVMPNGSNLMGHLSATQMFIVPKPGSPHLFYLFTSDCNENTLANGNRYSVVDMRLNGGLGDVTNEKNILLTQNSTERVAAIKKSNGLDYWIITHEIDNNRWKVFSLDCTGVNPNPVVSNVGLIHPADPGLAGSAGQLKLSPDGKKIAVAIFGVYSGNIELLDFNISTGILSNPIPLSGLALGSGTNYGVEFSPNSRLLYASPVYEGTVLQYDISSNNAVAINASRNFVSGYITQATGGVQLGPDNKIYCSTINTARLSVINNPNVYGTGCNFTLNSLNIIRDAWTGLPTRMPADTINVNFTYSFIGCQVKFDAVTNLTGITGYSWQFGDGTSLTGPTAYHSYRRTGTFPVKLIVRLSSSCGGSDSIVISKPVSIQNIFSPDFVSEGSCLNDVTKFYDNTILTLGNITGRRWLFGDNSSESTEINPTHSYTQPGEYEVKLIISSDGICNADSMIKKIYIDTKPQIRGVVPNGCIETPLQFQDLSTMAAGNVNVWKWYFGNGDSSLLQSPIYQYPDWGVYQVKLYASSEHGCSSDSSFEIAIDSKPIIDFNVELPCTTNQTVFTGIATNMHGLISEYQWRYGDGGQGLGSSSTHQYSTSGMFPVLFQVSTANGCNTTLTKNITIRTALANAGRDTIALYDQPLQLQGSGGITYQWQPSFGLNNESVLNPVFQGTSDATYLLTTTDSEGCTASDEINIKVVKDFTIYVPSAFSPDGNGTNDVLKPIGFGIKQIKSFRVFNRLGQQMFSTTKLDTGWDGRYKSLQQSPGAYVWIVEAVDMFGKTHFKQGASILVR